jgi:hypothetical protein
VTRQEVIALAERVLRSPKRVGAKKLAEWLLANQELFRNPISVPIVLAAHATFTLGHKKRFVLTFKVDSPLAVGRLQSNAPTPGFVKLFDPRVQRDAYDYSVSSLGQDRHALGALKRGDKLTLTAEYTGIVPPGYARGDTFGFALTMKGRLE